MDYLIFTNIYASLNRIFSQQDILFRPVPDKIFKWLYLTTGIACGSGYDMMRFKVLKKDVFIIRSPEEMKDEFLRDTILLNDDIAIVFIIPKDISTPSNDIKKIRRTIEYIHSICGYLCSFIQSKLIVDKNSSLYKVISKAPIILTIHIISLVYTLYPEDMKKYIPKIDKDKGDIALSTILSNDGVYELLDCGAVLGITLYKKEDK